MTTKRKNFTYDDKSDADVENWLDSLPSKKHSYYIRKAIKYYIDSNNSEDNTIMKEIQGIKSQLQEMQKKGMHTEDNELSDDNELIDAESTKDILSGKF